MVMVMPKQVWIALVWIEYTHAKEREREKERKREREKERERERVRIHTIHNKGQQKLVHQKHSQACLELNRRGVLTVAIRVGRTEMNVGSCSLSRTRRATHTHTHKHTQTDTHRCTLEGAYARTIE